MAAAAAAYVCQISLAQPMNTVFMCSITCPTKTVCKIFTSLWLNSYPSSSSSTEMYMATTILFRWSWKPLKFSQYCSSKEEEELGEVP